MKDRGIEIVSYFHVDNPLVQLLDELFLGLHRVTKSEMSAKVTPKADDLEKVGCVAVFGPGTSIPVAADRVMQLLLSRAKK